LWRSYKSVGDCHAIIAEFWGVLEGLRLVSKIGFTNVEVSIDSKVVVQAIHSGRTQGAIRYSSIKRIRSMLNKD
jgi:ribonuclease HI